MELKQQRWRRQRERQKNNRFIISKTKNFARASRFFVHFLAVVARFLISRARFDGVGDNTKISFSFS